MRHYIRANQSVAWPRRLLFIDSETEKRDIGGVEMDFAYMSWCCFIELRGQTLEKYTEVWRFFTDMGAMWGWIQALALKRRPLYIVASNVTFDLMATGGIDELTKGGWTLGFYHEASHQLILKIGKQKRSIVFLNLQNFYPFGIKQLGKMLGKEKGKVDFEASTFEEIKEYCKLDVEILRDAFLAWLAFIRTEDMGRWGLTHASQAWNAYRHRFMEHKILPLGESEEDKFCREGYFGGRCECFWIGDGRDGDFYYLDINSMYPFVMRDRRYPSILIGKAQDVPLEKLSPLLSKYCVVGRVKVWTEEPVYPVRHGDRMVFPVGILDVMLGTEGIKWAMDHYDLLEVKELYLFTGEKIFTTWVKGMYAERQKATQDGDKLRAFIYKKLLNCLYGKFGQTYPDTLFSEYTESSDFESHKVYYDNTPVTGMEYTMFHKHFGIKGKKAANKSNVAIALHVTEYARFHLWRLISMAGVDHVFYCDTDSLIVDAAGYEALSDQIDKTELGKLKLERKGSRLTIRAPKDYRLGSYKRQKGIRSDAEEIAPGVYRQIFFPGFKTLLAKGVKTGFPIGTVEKELTYNYTKGIVGEDGRVTPLSLSGG